MMNTPLFVTDDALEACMLRRRNLELVFDALTDGIIAVTKDGVIYNMNTAAENMLGTRIDELLGVQLDRYLSELSETDVKFVNDGLQRSDDEDGHLELRIHDPKNGIRSLALTLRVLRDEGEVRGAVVILYDKTEVERLRGDLSRARGPGNIVGSSPVMHSVFEMIREVAQTDTTVLIEGETGTGKELAANAIHELSTRSAGPLVKVNCAALPEGLLESELFGHVRGSFTGAVSDRIGRFEMAEGGTLFLDEISSVSPTIQVKLLRVLQERTFERVGEGKTRTADVRVISATNVPLQDEVAAGRFRDDLYYRLHVFPIKLPPLRNRMGDVPLLAEAILGKLAGTGKTVPVVTDDAMRMLLRYDWPGNVRELHAALEYSLVRSRGEAIEPHHLPDQIGNPRAPKRSSVRECDLTPATVRAALEEHGGKKTEAAKSLGISRVTLWRKIKEWGIES